MKSALSVAQESQEEAYYRLDINTLESMIVGGEVHSAQIRSRELSFLGDDNRTFTLFTLYFPQGLPTSFQKSFQVVDASVGAMLYLPCASRKKFAFALRALPGRRQPTRGDVEYLAQKIRMRLEIGRSGFLMAASGGHGTLSELHEAFLETTLALNTQSLFDSRFRCLFFGDVVAACPVRWDRETEFLFRVESGAVEAVETLVGHLFDTCEGTEGCTLGDVKRYCEYIVMQCRMMLNDYQSRTESLNGALQGLQGVVNTLFSLGEIREYYRQSFARLAGLMGRRSVYTQGELIGKVQTYIQRNYQRDITQDLIASLFYVNRSYLSKHYRDKTGQKFVDYLNEVRLGRAKELLRNTNQRVFVIARSVGYENTKYFFRVFKKNTGLSPEEYRKQSESELP